MNDKLRDYEDAKKAIYGKKTRNKPDDFDDFDEDLPSEAHKQVVLNDVLQVGTKVLIGGGLGLLAGVATIAVAASAAEVVVTGAITKVAGVIGGAMGLSLGLNKHKKLQNTKT